MNKTFDILVHDLISWTIFYFPDTMRDHVKNMSILNTVPLEKYNTLAYFEEEYRSSIDVKELDHRKIITKRTQLDKNLYALFAAKDDYDDNKFKFLLGKYKEHVDAYCFITKWLYDNAFGFIKEIPDDIYNLFRVQLEITEKHQKEFYDHFNLSPAKLAGEEIRKRISDPNFKINVPDFSNLKPEKAYQNKRKKKPVIITEEEADKFLLETVFNYNKN